MLASSFVIMSLTEVVSEKMSQFTSSACEALMHFDLVIEATNRSRWTIEMWFARGCSSLSMATARCQQAIEGARTNLFPIVTWRSTTEFTDKLAALRIVEPPWSGCGMAGVVLRVGVGQVAPVLASNLAAVINPCPWLAARVMMDAVWFSACAGVWGKGLPKLVFQGAIEIGWD
jgi:hypothetical protein